MSSSLNFLPLPAVPLDSWRLRISASGPAGAPTEQNFLAPLNLLTFLAQNSTLYPVLQSQIQERLIQDPSQKAWKRARSLLKNSHHFKRYRSRHYNQYHAAARAVALGMGASSHQLNLYSGLMAEIASSAVVLPPGQVLFHGRGDDALHRLVPYPTFVSTSLDPVVAIGHAIKRAQQQKSHPVVYQLTLQSNANAFYGQARGSFEYELLFPAGMTASHSATHQGSVFDIVEATIN